MQGGGQATTIVVASLFVTACTLLIAIVCFKLMVTEARFACKLLALV